MIKIDSIHFQADQKLLSFVEKKLEKIQTRHNEITSIKVKMSLENSGQVKDKIVEIVTHLPRQTMVSSGSDKTFERAASEAIQNQQRQLKRYKERLRESHRS